MNEKQLVHEIIKYAGGEGNIKKATHCVTRLRLYLNDDSLFDMKGLKTTTDLTTVVSAGQYQIIIGPGLVDDVYNEFVKTIGLNQSKNDPEVSEEKDTVINRFIALLASIFQPTLSLLAGAGIIKAVVALLVAFGVVNDTSSTYVILNALGDTFFMMFPIFIGTFAFKTFGGNPLLGAAVGAVLVNPDITAFGQSEVLYTMFDGTHFASNVQAEFLGLPIMLTRYGYYYSVIPIIFISWMGVKIEKLSKKIYPKTIQMFMVSATTITLSVILGLLIVGPVISIVSGLLADTFLAMKATIPVIYGAVLGGLWQIIVLFGLHWAIVPFSFIEFAEYQAGNVDKMTFIAAQTQVCFATIGAVLAVIIKERNTETTKMGIPAFIVGFLGITEPALYGITLPKKTPFIMSCIASAVSGAYIAFTNVGTYMIGGSGILGVPATLNPEIKEFSQQADFFNLLIASGIAFGLAFILTALSYKRKNVKISDLESSQITSPVAGSVIDIRDVNDQVFSSGDVGEGVAIKPISNSIVAPTDCVVKSIFPTKHAIGLETNDGIELLLHIGINTVELEGKYFDIKVKEGQKLQRNQEIVKVDFDGISSEGYETDVILINTNKKSMKKNINVETADENVIIKF